jgi:hypothetical protein
VPCLFLVILLTVVAVGSAGCQPRSTARSDVTVAATVTAAELRGELTQSVTERLTAFADRAAEPGAAIVRLVVGGSPPRVVAEQDLTPLRANGKVEHGPQRRRLIEAAVGRFAAQVQGARSTAPGLDVLTLLDYAARTRPGTDLIVVSSGLSTTDPVDWRALTLSASPADVVRDLASRGLLPDLAGHDVTFIGLGQTGGTQPALPISARRTVQQLWAQLCQAARGRGCRVVDEPLRSAPPLAAAPVPVVPVPATCTRVVSLHDNVLGFAPNSAELSPAADAALKPLAEQIIAGHLQVDVVGHIADVDPRDRRGGVAFSGFSSGFCGRVAPTGGRESLVVSGFAGS